MSIDLIKEILSGLFTLHKELKILPDLRDNSDNIMVPHRILAQEIKLNLKVLDEFDMLNSQGTTTNSISLIVTFFVTYSEGQLIDDIGCRAKLSVADVFVAYHSHVALSDSLDGVF